MIVEKSSKPDKTTYKCDRCGKLLKAKERVGFYKASNRTRDGLHKYMDLCQRCSKILHYGVFIKPHLKNQE